MEVVVTRAKPTVANVEMTDADTEYSYDFPEATTEFWMKLRDPGYPAKIAVVEGDSGTTYYTISNGETLKAVDIKSSNMSVFFQSPQAAMDMEIISFK